MILFALFIDLFRLCFLLDRHWNTILPAWWALLIGMSLLHVNVQASYLYLILLYLLNHFLYGIQIHHFIFIDLLHVYFQIHSHRLGDR
jgi:hypothetical protein